MASYQTPEIVVRSAEDYLDLGKEQYAFDLLINYMTGKKPRQWSTSLEKIMTMIIDLALKFNKKSLIKEPLNNYKFTAQYSNITSLETVLSYFAKAAEDLYGNVAKMASEKALEMEDLESEDPDELFISSLDVDSKTEKEIIRSSLKGIWDSYKIIIDIVSRNKKLEDLYATIAHKAFEFCKRYNRKSEFKRLCESMRLNLNNIIKSMIMNPDYHKIPFAIDLTNVETNEKQMLIRFDMLDYAHHFSLWQETTKILEDIHNIMQKRRAVVKPKILSDYFENLAKMFWRSEFYHYHAVSYFNHYSLLRAKHKNISSEDLTQKSCTFVLSVLCIPPLMNEANQSEDARNKVISFLSSESNIPSKQELITYINKHNILDLCTEEVRELFFLVEDSKNMVSLTRNSEPLLKTVGQQYSMFSKQLQNIIIYKLLSLLSKLYTKLKIDNFSRFLGSLDYSFCENIIHLASTSDHIKVRIDHKRRLLIFQDDVQDMHNLSLKFVNFSEDLKEVIHNVEHKKEEAKDQKGLTDLREEARRYADSATAALNRRLKLISDMKKVDKERDAFTRPKPSESRVEAPSRNVAANEARAEAVRKIKKNEETIRAYDEQRKQNLIKQFKGAKGFKIGKKKLEDLTQDEISNLSLETLEEAKKAWDRREKEKEEAAIKNAFKRADYLERAKREEYISILKKNWEQSQGEKEEIMKIHKENFEKMLEFRNRIKGAKNFLETYVTRVEEERTEAYEEEMQEFREKIIEDFKPKILAQARETLKDQLEAEEAEKKKREEEAKKLRERLELNTEEQINSAENRPFARNSARAEDMRRQEEPKRDEPKGFARGGFERSAADDKKTVITRDSGMRRTDEPSKPTTVGFSRNMDAKKEETKAEETQRPRFMNAKKEGGEEKKNPFGNARVTEQPQPTATTDDGWKTTTKKEEAPKPVDDWRSVAGGTTTTGGSGFQRGAPTTSTPTTGAPVSRGFTRGAPSANTNTNTDSKDSKGPVGWRK